MANLISDIMGMASPAIIDKVASSFGISGAAATSLLGAAVPGVMGALINKGSTPGGAKDILAGLVNASPNLSSALIGGDANAVATQGTSMLSSLIGNSGFATLSNAIASNAGVPAAAGASMMGLASQMVMSGLSKNAAGLDGAGLSKLLASQKDNVQQMLPAGLGSILGMSGMAGMATSAMKTATSTASSAASTASNTVHSTAAQTEASMADASASGMGWLKYAIPVAIIAMGAWYFLGMRGNDDVKMAKPAATTAAPAATAAAPAASTMMIGDVDVSKNLTGALGDLTASLGGITDVASAQAALPKLQGAGTAITTITGLADKFSPEQKAAVAGLVNSGLPGITAAANKAESIAGVGDLLKPVLDGIVASLGTMK